MGNKKKTFKIIISESSTTSSVSDVDESNENQKDKIVKKQTKDLLKLINRNFKDNNNEFQFKENQDIFNVCLIKKQKKSKKKKSKKKKMDIFTIIDSD
ncbi:hypothetical protein CPAV1605_587 [seawater metagenome]|uniref:Uncharacterized protein n=1 Tax=seawater metagenome TaxID=1561972 RepID=A0A5E8CLQ7_9ZZZZ